MLKSNSSASLAAVDHKPGESLPTPKLRFKLGPVIRFVLWAGLLAPWTWVLLVPIPQKTVQAVGGASISFWIGKTLHIGVYATLGLLTSCLPVGRKWRILAALFLISHGGTTEYLQQFVQRGASGFDFARDTLGVCLGCLVAWRCWRRRGDPLGVLPQEQLEPDAAGEDRQASHLR